MKTDLYIGYCQKLSCLLYLDILATFYNISQTQIAGSSSTVHHQYKVINSFRFIYRLHVKYINYVKVTNHKFNQFNLFKSCRGRSHAIVLWHFLTILANIYLTVIQVTWQYLHTCSYTWRNNLRTLQIMHYSVDFNNSNWPNQLKITGRNLLISLLRRLSRCTCLHKQNIQK